MAGWGYFFLALLILIILIPACWIVYTRIRASRAGLPPPPWSSYLHPFSSKSHESSSSRIYPASRSPLDWIKEKLSSLRGSGGGGGRSRAGGGAYEPTGARRGLDPDEAWDSRVGAEADAYGAGGYYEEQELGLHPPPAGSDTTAYLGAAGGGAGGRGGVLPDYGEGDHNTRGRQLSRDEDEEDDDTFVGGNQRGLDSRYDEEVHGGGGGRGGRGGEDPFGDHAEQSSLRGISPRPVVDTTAAAADGGGGGGLKPGGKAGDTSPTERRSMFRESI